MPENMIERTRVGERVFVWVDSEGKWHVQHRGLTYNPGIVCPCFHYALDYAALTLRSVEAFEVALNSLLDDDEGVTIFDDKAVRKLMKQVYELWTFDY